MAPVHRVTVSSVKSRNAAKARQNRELRMLLTFLSEIYFTSNL